MKIKNLQDAKRNKNDEFYTEYSDIEKEISNYYDQINGKIIYCNCDDVDFSQFYRFFLNNIVLLKIKKVYFTALNKNEMVIITNILDRVEVKRKNLNSSGDFRSKECQDIMKKSDLIITNPPFSLFRQFVSLVMEYKKDFLIIGNQNAITYKNIFHHIINKEIRVGYNQPKSFMLPNGSFQKFGNICWFTNLLVEKKSKFNYTKKYNEEYNDYKMYDNYSAIEINKVKDIPKDYYGVIGVPASYLFFHDEKEFKIVGMSDGSYDFEFKPIKKYINPIQHNKDGTKVNGSKINTRAMMQVLNSNEDSLYYSAKNAELKLKSIYARIFIKKIK